MNFTDIRFFIENQLEEAEKNKDTPEAGALFLLMADYLLEQVEQQPDVFTGNTGRQLRQAFLRCSKMSKRIGSYADQYGDAVAQEAEKALAAIKENKKKLSDLEDQCQTVESTMETIQSQEKQIAADSIDLEQKNAELLAEEKKLKTRKEDYLALENRIKECKQIQETMTDQKMEELRTELDKTEPEATDRRNRYLELEKKLKDAKETVDALDQELEKIMDQISSTEKEKDDLEKVKIPQAQQELEAVTRAKKENEEKHSRLVRLLVEAGADDEELKALMQANDRITESLKQSGFFTDEPESLDRLQKEVQSLRQQAAPIMESYNKILGDTIQTARKSYEILLQRQEPGYKG